jgi:23S rRNA pseudouridine1911/1915/1917 synthase
MPVETPRTLIADRGDAGLRLDLVLRRHLRDVAAASRTRVQAWIESGRVTVNGAPIRRTSARAARGDIVAIALPEAPLRAVMAAEPTPLGVLYEDEQFLAVDKPAGAIVHPAYKHPSGTIMNALLWHARAWPTGQRPSLVGRLDKDTSGVLLVARSAAAHASLQRTMASDGAEKDYLVVVYGRVNIARCEIDLKLRHDPSDRRRIVASAAIGAPSLTRVERIARSAGPGPGVSLLRCRLVTGRTHQIRVHLAARGWPIVGDPVYGHAQRPRISDPALDSAARRFPRQALHAWRVALTHPVTGERILIEAPPPEDFQELLAAAGLRGPDCAMPAANDAMPAV